MENSVYCLNCQEELPPSRKFLCSKDCWEQYNYKIDRCKSAKFHGQKRYCWFCYKTFVTRNGFKQWCSRSCEIKWRNRRIDGKWKRQTIEARQQTPKPTKRTEPNMQSLYNCKRIDADHYRITKFDSGFVPFEHHDGTVSSYTCTEKDCDCPQGHKASCRHRKMLPFFLEEEHVGDNWFFVWDTHQWIKADGIFAEAAEEQELNAQELVDTMEAIGIHTVVVDETTFLEPHITPDKEGGHKPASATPSSRPSTYRRMR